MDRLLAMSHFLRVVERGSFSAAARDLRTTQSNVSHSLQQLESYLGARLLHRNTRHMALTAEGGEYLKRARQILEDVEDADSTIGKRAKALGGTLRVFAPVSLGRQHVVPHLARFLAQHPALDVDLVLSDWPQDMLVERRDVAIRVGALADTADRRRLLGKVPLVAVAASNWRRGKSLKTPADLARHSCVCFNGPQPLDTAIFVRQEMRHEVRLSGRFHSSSSEAILAATRAGLGFSIVPRWLVSESLAQGGFSLLFPHWKINEPLAVTAVFPETRKPTARVLHFIDFLTECFEAARLFAPS